MDKAQQIISQIKSGDKEAFSLLYHSYYPKIFSFLFKILKDYSLAEELVQEVFFRLWINREKLQPEMAYDSYFFTIAKNLAFNFFKKKNTEHSFMNIAVENEYSDDTPEKHFDFIELQQLINNAIEVMSPQQRLVFKLSRNNGLLNIEIAEQLGISKRTVEKHISNSLNILRKLVRKHYLLLFF